MKAWFLLFTAGCVILSTAAYGSETAQARFYCESVQCQRARATSVSDGANWTLDLSTLPSGINGELAPHFLTTSYSHSAYVELYNDLTEVSDQGVMGLDVPDGGDANGDGFPDFFEVSQAVNNLTSSGVVQSPNFYPGGFTFQATWNRAAGSATGTCSFQLPDPDSGYYYNLQYSFTFTILEYTGPLTYTPGSKTVVAAVNLTQHGDNLAYTNTLQGPILFDKSTTDPFNTLTNRPGIWTNAAMQTLTFTNDLVVRYGNRPTTYVDYYYMMFADGNPDTADPDYLYWVLSIDDTNDANSNGIPDFSDNPAVVAPPRAPQLTLSPGTTNLWLTISGDTAHTNLVQKIGSLTATNWQTILTFVATNDPEVVSLPPSAGSTTFYRVVTR